MKAFTSGKRNRRSGWLTEMITMLEVDGEFVKVKGTVAPRDGGFVPSVVEVVNSSSKGVVLDVGDTFVLDGDYIYAEWEEAVADMLKVLTNGVFWIGTGRRTGHYAERKEMPLNTAREIKAAAETCIREWLEPKEAFKNRVVVVNSAATKKKQLGELEKVMCRMLNRNPWMKIWEAKGAHE